MREYTAMELEHHVKEYRKLKTDTEKYNYLKIRDSNWFSLGILKRIYREVGGTNKALSNTSVLYTEILNKLSARICIDSKTSY